MRISIFLGRYLGQEFCNIFIRGEIIKGLLIFIIFVVISSYPLEFLSFNESIILFLLVQDMYVANCKYWSICPCTSSARLDMWEWMYWSTHWFARNISTKKYIVRVTGTQTLHHMCSVGRSQGKDVVSFVVSCVWPSWREHGLHVCTKPGWLPSKYIQCHKLKTL